MSRSVFKSAFAKPSGIFTFIFLISLVFSPHSFAQIAELENVVRLVYFVPNNRQPQAGIDTRLDILIKDAQRFYADEMERHGFGRKTFKFEIHQNGRAVVHRVNGQFNDAYYRNNMGEKVERELYQHFNRFKNIYFVVIEMRSEFIGGGGLCGIGGSESRWRRYPGESIEVQRGGISLIPASGWCFENEHLVAYHELGHTFGLGHDFRNDAYVMSYGEKSKNRLSSCAADWLDVSGYFNPGQREVKDFPTAEMLTPLAASGNAIRLRFKVTDMDGIHQAQLFIPTVPGDAVSEDSKLQSCRSLNGKNSSIVEFVTSQLTPRTRNKVNLHMIDVNGNFYWHKGFWVDTTDLLPPSKVVSLPDANLAAVIRKKLGMSRTDEITQFDMLKLAELTAGGRQVKDLNGLAHAKNLRVLKLFDNQIQDITPLATLTKLEILSLDRNQISDISVLTKLQNLTHLRVAGNPIVDRTPLQTLLRRNPKLELDINATQVSPVVQLSDTELPPIYWIDRETSGIYHLASGKKRVENIAPGVLNVRGIAIDMANKRLYWTERTSNDTGKVRSASLNGSNIQLVGELTSVPSEIVVDVAAGNLYIGLDAEHGLALDVSGRKLYWGERNSIWREELNGRETEERVIFTSSEVKSIAIGNNKLYWAVQTGERLGEIRRANLNGSNSERLVMLKSVPLSVAIDTPGRKLYWSNSLGRIQRAALNGKNIQTVMSGLGTPVSLVLGVPAFKLPLLAAPAAVLVTPDKTRLYPNYPNPFNPETWIPYQLAEPADVTLHIYGSNGVLIRSLALGYRVAGIYDSKRRAAYWDGKNDMGEPVASGVYFYTLSAGDFRGTRKMLIRK